MSCNIPAFSASIEQGLGFSTRLGAGCRDGTDPYFIPQDIIPGSTGIT